MKKSHASVLAVGLCAFFAVSMSAADAAEYAGNIKVRVLLKSDTTSLGQRLVYPETTHPEVTAIEVEIPPGGETGWHHHPASGYGYVLSGVLTLETAEGKTFTFPAGEAFAEVVKARHNGRNLGKEPVKLVAFFPGEKGSPFTIKDEE